MSCLAAWPWQSKACAGAAARHYITEVGGQNILKYKYKGCDNSMMYRYFCSPLADAIVRGVLPLWVAPNVITCFSLVPSLLGHCVIWYYCNDFRTKCPSWCWVVSGICTFLYQTLDNMDGKQARRTGSSSPLGLLLDHGVDALNITLSSLNVMALLQVRDSWMHCLIIWSASACPFFFATWEEFYTGSLFLGILNGPTDGVLILCASQIFSALVDDYEHFWSSELAFGVSHKTAMIAFYAVCVIFTVAANFVAVARFHWEQPSDRMSEKLRLRDALAATLPFCLSLSCAGAWFAFSGARVFFWQPRLIFWFLGFIFQQQVMHLQLAHICADVYRPWRKTFVISHLFVAVNLVSSAWGMQILDEMLLICGCVSLAAWSCLHMAWWVPLEMSDVLGIRVFSIHLPNGSKHK